MAVGYLTMTEPSFSRPAARTTLAERMIYPEHPLMRRLAQSPILFWRMGFGPLIGRFFLILTHIGRHTGKVRRTALEYQMLDGRVYVFNAWPQADWYHNILAEPRVTVQTGRETFAAAARPLVTQHDYLEAYALVERSPVARAMLTAMGIDTSLAGFLAAKDDLEIVTFDPSEAPGPPPLQADLRWLSPVAAVTILTAVGVGFIAGKRVGEGKRRPKGWWQEIAEAFTTKARRSRR